MIDVRRLVESELARATEALPLHRLDPAGSGTYLVAWDGEAPVGHVHIAWDATQLRAPELQDMYVLPERRGEGVGTALARAAELLAAERGHRRCSLSVSDRNDGAQRLYERLGYVRADVAPKRVHGTIAVRGGQIEVDDTLVYFEKDVDFAARRSS